VLNFLLTDEHFSLENRKAALPSTPPSMVESSCVARLLTTLCYHHFIIVCNRIYHMGVYSWDVQKPQCCNTHHRWPHYAHGNISRKWWRLLTVQCDILWKAEDCNVICESWGVVIMMSKLLCNRTAKTSRWQPLYATQADLEWWSTNITQISFQFT